MKPEKAIKQSSDTINEINELQKKVNSANDLVKEVDSINQVINNLLYTRDNFIVDLKNFSIMNITPPQDLR